MASTEFTCRRACVFTGLRLLMVLPCCVFNELRLHILVQVEVGEVNEFMWVIWCTDGCSSVLVPESGNMLLCAFIESILDIFVSRGEPTDAVERDLPTKLCCGTIESMLPIQYLAPRGLSCVSRGEPTDAAEKVLPTKLCCGTIEFMLLIQYLAPRGLRPLPGLVHEAVGSSLGENTSSLRIA